MEEDRVWLDNDDKIMDIWIILKLKIKDVFQLFVLFVGKRRDIYIFIEIWREMNEEVCGYGVVHAIISHTLCIDCRNGGKILKK